MILYYISCGENKTEKFNYITVMSKVLFLYITQAYMTQPMSCY